MSNKFGTWLNLMHIDEVIFFNPISSELSDLALDCEILLFSVCNRITIVRYLYSIKTERNDITVVVIISVTIEIPEFR